MYTPLNLAEEHRQTRNPNYTAIREAEWRSKELHGRFPAEMEKSNKQESNKYIISGTLYPETEGFLFAIQDQVISTRNYRKYIIRDTDEPDKCRLCGKPGETIQHLTTGCTYLANSEYLTRHDQSCKIIHLFLAKRDNHNVENQPFYTFDPPPVLDNNTSKLYWNRTLQTEGYVRNNRPDITYIDKINKKGYLIDVSHPADHNLEMKEAEKISKYLPLAAEVKALHNLEKVIIVPVIISANGLISRQTTTKAWELKIPRRIIFKAQLNAVLHTCSIVRRIMNGP